MSFWVLIWQGVNLLVLQCSRCVGVLVDDDDSDDDDDDDDDEGPLASGWVPSTLTVIVAFFYVQISLLHS